MEIFRIIAIGQNVGSRIQFFLDEQGINSVNPVKIGKFGNLTTLTFLIEMPEGEVIEKRKSIVRYFSENDKTLACAYDRSDWMTAYIFDRTAFHSQDLPR